MEVTANVVNVKMEEAARKGKKTEQKDKYFNLKAQT